MVNKRSLTYNRDAAFAFSYFSYTLSSSFLIFQIMRLMQIDNLGILHDLNDILERITHYLISIKLFYLFYFHIPSHSIRNSMAKNAKNSGKNILKKNTISKAFLNEVLRNMQTIPGVQTILTGDKYDVWYYNQSKVGFINLLLVLLEVLRNPRHKDLTLNNITTIIRDSTKNKGTKVEVFDTTQDNLKMLENLIKTKYRGGNSKYMFSNGLDNLITELIIIEETIQEAGGAAAAAAKPA